MKIYTKTGDKGTTSLFGGERVPKHHIRIESYGTVDELNSWIGLIRDHSTDVAMALILEGVQNKLFTAGAILATPPSKEVLKSGKKRLNIERIEEEDLSVLETAIDQMETELPPMTHFVLPGGHPHVSYCHIARTVCRRAERRTSQLNEIEEVEEIVIRYLNRLSDYLFVLARKLSNDLQAKEVKWIPTKKE
ncbi:cob(I)yrinic acid a,c-diamide adenosyltransferase [Robertkochia solimangrovi]|uniref:cob(I)yrinic acid a,c-diamide adenosyltransferase n=1 Tax=Robertkochia solimangrovi TaxID=2213046 RepID=UPI00117F95A3|nr:cob(I)yrinic acid a,c-diamide adenosyltransferase [Robertkochia solimangrovi]TRZ42819.1 cob(I)yrinic acid a,c-diamide adenosyltransferase [Robertkochia solimangrovi]